VVAIGQRLETDAVPFQHDGLDLNHVGLKLPSGAAAIKNARTPPPLTPSRGWPDIAAKLAAVLARTGPVPP